MKTCKKCGATQKDRFQLMNHAHYQCINRKRKFSHLSNEFTEEQHIFPEEEVHFDIDLPIYLPGPGNTCFLQFQRRLQNDYSDRSIPFQPGPIKVNGGSVIANWKDYADIFIMQCCHGLSDAQASVLMDRIKIMALRRGFVMNLPKLGRSIRDLITTKMMRAYEIRKFQVISMNLRVNCVSANILEIAAEQLLRRPAEDFHIRPLEIVNTHGERIIREPATAEMFEEYFNFVQERWGIDTYPLCITISGDGLALNKTGSAGACPWYVHLANWNDKQYNKPGNIDLLGFSPFFPFTNAELSASADRKSKSVVDEQVKSMHHYMDMQFLDKLLEPLLEHQENGIMLQVGTLNNH